MLTIFTSLRERFKFKNCSYGAFARKSSCMAFIFKCSGVALFDTVRLCSDKSGA